MVRLALNLAASSYPELRRSGGHLYGCNMHTWFQNLNDNGRLWFHFRGSVGPDYPQEMDSAARLAVSMYFEDHMRDVHKYGSGSGERGTKRGEIYTYIGRQDNGEH